MNLINTRESQFELLRIVAIFMVLIHHSLAVADTFGYTGHYTLNEGITGVLLNRAVIIGVNLFVLITERIFLNYGNLHKKRLATSIRQK